MKTYLLVASLVIIPACNNDNLSGGMDLATPDLSSNIDMAMKVPNGVICGAATCTGTQVCCLEPASMTESCVAAGKCPDGGVPEMCDGPEDCSTAAPDCCFNGSFAAQMGDMGGFSAGAAGAMCLADSACPANATYDQGTGAGTISTKLCHMASDCVGYTGTVPLLGPGTDFSSCCSAPMAPGVKFCAPSQITLLLKGATCN
jgi:hypothetical protein